MRFVEKLFLKNLRRTAEINIIFFMTLAFIIFLIHGFINLGFQFPLDYGEGPLLNQALRITQGQSLYPSSLSSPPYLISNYPPVFVIINAFFVWIFGPGLLIGRLISFLSTIGTAIFIFLTLRIFFPTHKTILLLPGAILFLIIPYVLEWASLFRIDMLALLFSMAGLYLVVREPQKNQSIIFAGILFILSAFTRQSFGFAGPLAAIIWTFTKDKRQAIKLFLIYALGGLVVFGVLYWTTGGSFFFHIITANVNPFSWQRVRHFMSDLASKMPWIIALLTLYLAVGWKYSQTYALLCPYLLAGFAASLTIGKVGSNINYLVEVSAGFAILVGVFFGRFTETLMIDQDQKPDFNFPKEEIPDPEDISPMIRNKLWVNLVIFLVLSTVFILQISGLARSSLFGPITNRRNRVKRGNDYVYLEENIKIEAQNGPVLADEFMAMLPDNHIPLFIQPFEMTQLANAGIWDQTPFLEALENQELPLILIHHFQNYAVYLERWTDEMRKTIFANYYAANMKADTLLFKPKDFNATAYPDGLQCPDAPWRLPTNADMGMLWESGQLLMMGDGHSEKVPAYAIADGLLYQFPGWKAAVAIQHEDPLQPGEWLWSFYGDMAPAFSTGESYIPERFLGAEAVPVKAGDLIGYQGRYLGPNQQTWLHLRFSLLPAEADGTFPEAFIEIDDFTTDLPGIREQERLGLGSALSLSTYTGLPESRLYGVFDFLPFVCTPHGD